MSYPGKRILDLALTSPALVLTTGSDATVGAAACITHSLPDDCTVVGVPAQPLEKDPTE